MFRHRIISFTGLLAVFAVIIYGGRFGFDILANTVFGLFIIFAAFRVVFETAKMVKNIGLETFPVLASLVSAVVILMCISIGLAFVLTEKYNMSDINILVMIYTSIFLLLLFSVPLMLFILLFSKDKKVYLKKIFASAGIVVFLTPMFACISLVYLMPSDGAMLLFFLLVTTKAMDTGGYIFGKLTSMLPGGNHKICPSISPKKSWEGLIGGLVLSLIAAFLFFRSGVVSNSLTWCMVSGAVLSLGSFAGDLTESALKRACEVKDSGNILPGMGGFFDLFDSFIYNPYLFMIMIVFA